MSMYNVQNAFAFMALFRTLCCSINNQFQTVYKFNQCFSVITASELSSRTAILDVLIAD